MTRKHAAEYGCVSGEPAQIAQSCAQHIARALKTAVAARGAASLMLSGGSSPKPLFKALQSADIDWPKISVSLVDERWVAPGEDGSNETFIKSAFLQGRAAEARFISLKTTAPRAALGLAEIEERFAGVAAPFDVCVMGMGLDSHTASWFPGSPDCAQAMSLETAPRFAAIDASGCAGAGRFPERITLTLTAVLSSRHIILFIPGTPKAEVFARSMLGNPYETPVGALKSAANRLTVYTTLGEGNS